MPDVDGRPDRSSGVVRSGLNVQFAKRRLLENLAISYTIESSAASQANFPKAGPAMDVVEQREVTLFEHRLDGGRDVGVTLVDCGAGFARGPEDVGEPLGVDRPGNRFATFPRHLDAAAVMSEVVEVEANLVAGNVDQLPHLRQEARLAVCSEAHHFVLVSVFWKTEVLRERRIEQAERMRKADRAESVEVVTAAHAPHHAGEIAEAIDGDHGSFVKWRHEERACEVSA